MERNPKCDKSIKMDEIEALERGIREQLKTEAREKDKQCDGISIRDKTEQLLKKNKKLEKKLSEMNVEQNEKEKSNQNKLFVAEDTIQRLRTQLAKNKKENEDLKGQIDDEKEKRVHECDELVKKLEKRAVTIIRLREKNTELNDLRAEDVKNNANSEKLEREKDECLKENIKLLKVITNRYEEKENELQALREKMGGQENMMPDDEHVIKLIEENHELKIMIDEEVAKRREQNQKLLDILEKKVIEIVDLKKQNEQYERRRYRSADEPLDLDVAINNMRAIIQKKIERKEKGKYY